MRIFFLKYQEAHKRRHPPNSFTMELAMELCNKNNGQHESIHNDAPHILLPSRNASCKVMNNDNLPLQIFFSISSKTSRATMLKKISVNACS